MWSCKRPGCVRCSLSPCASTQSVELMLSEVLPKNPTSGLNSKHTGNEPNETPQTNTTKIHWAVQGQERARSDQSPGNDQPDRHPARGASAPSDAVEATTLAPGPSRL